MCGEARTFIAGVQWCSNCGWNREAALARLRLRYRIMAGVAACLLIGEAFLFYAAPMMGIIYLPLFGFLAGAVAIIPYRDYRKVLLTAGQSERFFPHGMTAIKLQCLRPHLRISSLLLLGAASAAEITFFLVPGSWDDIVLPASLMLGAIIIFTTQFIRERRIVANYATALARINSFERGGRRGRYAIYEFESPAGLVRGKGASLNGFAVGMSVPVLYHIATPHNSIPVPDFIFHKIQAEL